METVNPSVPDHPAMVAESSDPSIPSHEQTHVTPSRDSVTTLSITRVAKPTSTNSFNHNQRILKDERSQLSTELSLLVGGPIEPNESIQRCDNALFTQTDSKPSTKHLYSYTSHFSIPLEKYSFTTPPERDDTNKPSIISTTLYEEHPFEKTPSSVSQKTISNFLPSNSDAASAELQNTDIRCEKIDCSCDRAISHMTSYVHEGYLNTISNHMIERMPDACIVKNIPESGNLKTMETFIFDEHKSISATHSEDCQSKIGQDPDCHTTKCNIVSSKVRSNWASVPSYTSETNTPYRHNGNSVPSNLNVEFDSPGCSKLEEKKSTDSQFHTKQSNGSKSSITQFAYSVPSNRCTLGSPNGSSGHHLSDCKIVKGISGNGMENDKEMMMEFVGQSLEILPTKPSSGGKTKMSDGVSSRHHSVERETLTQTETADCNSILSDKASIPIKEDIYLASYTPSKYNSNSRQGPNFNSSPTHSLISNQSSIINTYYQNPKLSTHATNMLNTSNLVPALDTTTGNPNTNDATTRKSVKTSFTSNVFSRLRESYSRAFGSKPSEKPSESISSPKFSLGNSQSTVQTPHIYDSNERHPVAEKVPSRYSKEYSNFKLDPVTGKVSGNNISIV